MADLLRILHTNDLHGNLPRVAESLRELRAEADLYLDSGDLVRTGNLGVPLGPDPAWPLLAELRADASTLGNRETHPLESAFRAKIAGAAHPLLVANVRRPDGEAPFPASAVFETPVGRVGVVGAMVPMATERMKTRAAWSLRWTAPLPALLAEAERLRPQVDLLFALTHVGDRLDREIAATGAFEAVFGGHSHTVHPEPLLVGRTWVAQGGSHGRYAGVYRWEGDRLQGGLFTLPSSSPNPRR